MQEYLVRIYSICGRTLARFLVVGSYSHAMRAGYERAEMYGDAFDVVAVKV